MKEYKIFVQRIGLVGMSNILLALSSLILLPILTKNFSIQDYGIWVQVYITMMLLPNIITLGLPYALIRFLSGEKDKKRIQEDFYSVTCLVIILSLVATTLLYLFKNSIASFLFNGNLAISELLPLIVFTASLNLLFLNFFITFQEIKKYSIFLLIQTYLNVLLNVVFVLLNLGIFFAVLAFLISQFTVFIIMLIMIINEIGFKIPNFNNLNEYLSFGIPIAPSNLSGWIIDSSDRYVINILLGIAFVGYYNPAYNLGMIIKMFITPITVILTPALSKYHVLDKRKEIKILLKYSLKYFLLLAIPAAFGLSILAEPLLSILTTSAIAKQSYLMVPFVAVSILFYGINGIVSQILFVEKKTKIVGYIFSLMAILNLILTIYFVPLFGIIGAAIATLATYLVSCILLILYTSRIFVFDFDLRFILKSIFASMIMSLFIYYLHPTTIINILITITISIIIYIAILIFTKGINLNEIKFFKSMLKAS